MIFLFFEVFLFFLACGEILSRRTNWNLFRIIYILLSLLTMVRYGVGTDFYTYEYIYKITPALDEGGLSEVFHGEIGYLFLSSVFKTFGIGFWFFNAIIAFISMCLFYFGIKKYCIFPFFSLLIFYSVFYFTYPFNAIRQGLTIAAFFGILLHLLINRKYKAYVVGTIILSFFHSSILFALFFPLLLKIRLNRHTIIILLLIALLFPVQKAILIITPSFLHTALHTYLDAEFSLDAFIARFVFWIPIIYLMTKVQKQSYASVEQKKMMELFLWGVFIYLMFASFSFIASRLNVYTRVLEIILLPLSCFSFKRIGNRIIFMIVFSFILFYLYIKNIDMLIDNSALDISFWQYPLFYYI